MSFLFGILAGFVMPLQTSINTRLRRSLGTPFRASGVNFFVGLCFLIVLSFILGDGLIPFRKLAGQPVWMFLGGFCGVTVLTGNLLLFPILGATQTIVFPLFGQIVMGILIDTFGWFRGDVVPLTLWRVLGAALVFAGVVLVALGGSSEEKADETRTQSQLWAARLFGVSFGTLGAVQTAINGQLGAFLDSPVQSSMMNFLVGWMWVGGFLGGGFVMFNVYLQHLLGTGLTVILNLIGLTAGGMFVDKTGVLESPKKPVTLQRVLGVLVMLGGAAMIRLL